MFDGFYCQMLSASWVAKTFFLDYRWFFTTNILPINSLIAINCWNRIAKPGRLLLGIAEGLNKISL